MAEEKSGLESLLSIAKEREKNYDWIRAAEVYSKILASLSSDDSLRLGNLQESKAHALYRYAFQASTVGDFKTRVVQAIGQYGKAKEAYSKLDGERSVPWTRRCDAMTSFLKYWPESTLAEKKRLMSEAWDQAMRAMDAFEEAKEYTQFAKTNNVLTFAVSIGYAYSTDVKSREELVKGALKYSEKAVKFLEEGGDEDETARACMNASYYLKLYYTDFVETDRRSEWDKRSGAMLKRAMKLSLEGSADALAYSYMIGGFPSSLSDDDLQELKRAVLDFTARADDKLRTGAGIEWLENTAVMKAHKAADSEEMVSIANEALAYAEKARQAYATVAYVHAVDAAFWSGSPESGYFALTASLETDLARKREFAQRGIAAFEDYLRTAEECGYPQVVAAAHSDAAKILSSLAKTDRNPEDRRKTLERAMDHLNQYLVMWQSIFPMCSDFFLASGKATLADIKRELVDLTDDPKAKMGLYREAISHIGEAYGMMAKDMGLYSGGPEKFCRWYLGAYQYQLADWSMQLHAISKDRSDLILAADAFKNAVDLYERADQPSRAAESHCKAAQAQDALGDYLDASKRFVMASDSYKKAAVVLPKLSSLYHDCEFYMQAWAQIELARHHHARQEGAAASECYERASSLHESTDKWKFLASNYKAWAEVEKGEDLSRKEKSKEAKGAFERAARLFGDARESLSGELEKIQNQDERENVTRLVKTADLRREYCEGRYALEEAKILDKQGDEFGSCERFGSAAERFERLHAVLESDQDRRETELIMTLTRAWQTMVKAEAEASPELYDQAALIFEQAKELSTGERAKHLTMGHSRFCKALAAGTKFADTADVSLHTVATQNLESAANHYLIAGLESDAEYATASKLLFDAYVYMNKADSEEDQAKKVKLFAMTEKMLEASAASYSKAEYPKKKDQVLKLLDKVSGARALALTLMDVLHAPDIVANTTTLPAPAPINDVPVGIQRFEHADIHVTLIAKPMELHVGQEISIDIELVNAGRGPAQLTKVEETVPKGFVVVQEPEKCRMEDSHVNLRGKRLDALESVDVVLLLKPTTKGRFKFRPRVLYLDDSGTCRSCEPAAVEIAVKEMGISGWIRGT